MPLKLKPPRAGKTPFYSVRGTYLGCYIDRSLATGDQRTAKRLLKNLENEIERGVVSGGKRQKGFAAAAASYMKAGGEGRFLQPLILHFTHTPLDKIDQDAADAACGKIYPDATPQTINRQFYTPLIAVKNYAGDKIEIKRPIGWRSPKKTFFLMPEKAFALLDACGNVSDRKDVNLRFRALNTLLLYCGLRLSEGLSIERSRIYLPQRRAYLPETKNGEPRPLFLPEPVVEALEAFPGGIDGEGRLFGWHKAGRLYAWLEEASKRSGVVLPPRVAFHVWRHTWATWMKGVGADLMKTGAWADRESADRYDHTEPSEEAKKAALLPTPPRGKSVEA